LISAQIKQYLADLMHFAVGGLSFYCAKAFNFLALPTAYGFIQYEIRQSIKINDDDYRAIKYWLAGLLAVSAIWALRRKK